MQVHPDSRTSISDSIVDAIDEQASACSANGTDPGGPLRITTTTVIGTATTRSLSLGSNSIFLGAVDAERVQDGCVRFSYLPPDSHVPRRYRCQPGEPVAGADAMPVRPRFTSLRYGDAAYCQLRPYCAAEIREGADDESEMGAFHSLRQAQRETNLRIRLREYLRFGLEAGIFYAS